MLFGHGMGEYLRKCFRILGCDQASRTNLKTEEGGFPASALKVSNKWAVFIMFAGMAVVYVGFKGDRELYNSNLFQVVPDKGEIRSKVGRNKFYGNGSLGSQCEGG